MQNLNYIHKLQDATINAEFKELNLIITSRQNFV